MDIDINPIFRTSIKEYEEKVTTLRGNLPRARLECVVVRDFPVKGKGFFASLPDFWKGTFAIDRHFGGAIVYPEIVSSPQERDAAIRTERQFGRVLVQVDVPDYLKNFAPSIKEGGCGELLWFAELFVPKGEKKK